MFPLNANLQTTLAKWIYWILSYKRKFNKLCRDDNHVLEGIIIMIG